MVLLPGENIVTLYENVHLDFISNSSIPVLRLSFLSKTIHIFLSTLTRDKITTY